MYKIKPGNDSVTVYYHGKPRKLKCRHGMEDGFGKKTGWEGRG